MTRIRQKRLLSCLVVGIISVGVGLTYFQRLGVALPVPSIRQLPAGELEELSHKALQGDCTAAYQVGQHYMYFSLNDSLAVKFFRIASRCDIPNAHANLISILAGRPSHDQEVDDALMKLKKLDPKYAEGAEVEITLRRQERSQE